MQKRVTPSESCRSATCLRVCGVHDQGLSNDVNASLPTQRFAVHVRDGCRSLEIGDVRRPRPGVGRERPHRPHRHVGCRAHRQVVAEAAGARPRAPRRSTSFLGAGPRRRGCRSTRSRAAPRACAGSRTGSGPIRLRCRRGARSARAARPAGRSRAGRGTARGCRRSSSADPPRCCRSGGRRTAPARHPCLRSARDASRGRRRRARRRACRPRARWNPAAPARWSAR